MFDEDNYRYIGRNTNKIYALGDTVRIVVREADLVKKQLSFEFEGMEEKRPSHSGNHRSGRSKEQKKRRR